MGNREIKLPKPKIGEPCNGCGLCCSVQVCRNGAFVLGLVDELGDTVAGPCPAIVHKTDGRMTCGVVENPNKYLKHRPYPAKVLSNNFARLIGAGNGCDELYEDDTKEQEELMEEIINERLNDKDYIKNAKLAIKVIHGIE